jgi:hypothetical protein
MQRTLVKDALNATPPQLKAEFEAKLSADEKFRGNADARLEWLYDRSKFNDDRYLHHPIGIER